MNPPQVKVLALNVPKAIGRYEIVEELGRGAMGSVFKAHDPAMSRTVAVKTILAQVLASGRGEEYRTRFYREARAAGSLAHPGIVPMFDVGEHEGMPYLVMEYVEGRTLSEAMKSGERFTLDRACEMGQQIAEALGYAHRKGVIHRDIKPSNILMTSREAYGSERPRITDFGVAKLDAGELTATGQLLGTPSFMPPEQFTGAPVDGRADLFSLGVILYSLATGEQPFPGETTTAVSYKVVHTEPVPPRRFNPAVPQQLEAVILKCLAKSPADRYQTGEELAEELAGIRGSLTGTAMRSVPVAAATGGDTDATLDLPAAGVSRGPGATPGTGPGSGPGSGPGAIVAVAGEVLPPQAARRGGRKMTLGAVAAVAVLIGLAAGGWLMARHRGQTVPAAAQQGAGPAAVQGGGTATPARVPAADQAGSAAAKSVPAASEAAPGPGAEAGAAAGTTAPVPRPRAAGVGFDPKSLDPKTNAKLKIEVSHFPDGVPFTVEMDRKIYLKAVAGNKGSFENVFVPPGVKEFRVVVNAGGQRKTSNTVSDDFKAKKRKTLKIELLNQGKGAAALGRDAQVFVTLR